MKKIILSLLVIAATSTQFGCAAIQHRNLETQIQMQQSIFVDPDKIDNRPVYVRVTNQTGKSDLNFEQLLIQKLEAKGYKTTKKGQGAGVRIMANFLYLDKAKEGMTAEGAIAGGAGGAMTGAVATKTYAGTGLGAMAGAGLGALAGSFVNVDT